MKKEISALSEELVDLAAAKNITLAFAESCTGGLIGASVTEVSGSLKNFFGGQR